jgi:hypothetical protein
MANARFSMAIGLLPILGTLILAAPSSAQRHPAAAETLAKTYGIESFGRIEAIRFTFNAELPGVNVSRSWIWEPKTDQVIYDGKDKSGNPVHVSYRRSQLDSEPANVKDTIDPGFVNDQYWLLFPFHAVWDGAPVEDSGTQKLPLGDGSAEKIVVKYSSDGGYSPGDTWELFVGPDGRIREMVFRRGSARKPGTVIATWTDYKKAGPLLVSLDHRGTADDKPLHVSFSNVAVRLAGANAWVDAQ